MPIYFPAYLTSVRRFLVTLWLLEEMPQADLLDELQKHQASTPVIMQAKTMGG